MAVDVTPSEIPDRLPNYNRMEGSEVMTVIDKSVADSLRPADLDGYIGQTMMKARLRIHIQNALIRGAPVDHILLVGPPGSGKTTLAGLVAAALRDMLMVAEMPLTDPDMRDMRDFKGFLFLDELHRGTKREQEELLPLLEHGYMRPKGKFRIDMPWLTVIGATTEPTGVIKPLRDRFPIQPHFDPYTLAEMAQITAGMARVLQVNLSDDDLVVIGGASAGTPRNIQSLMLAASALQTVNHTVTAAEVLAMCRVTPEGLTPDHANYLGLLRKMDAPVGQVALRNMLDVNESQLLELERVLTMQGLLLKSPRGRELTTPGYRRAKELETNAP